MKKNFNKFLIGSIILLTMSACTTIAPQKEASLYDRLGGKDCLQKVVSDFVDKVVADERIQNAAVIKRMNEIDLDQLKNHLTNQFCMATGGPCQYTGRTMKVAHRDLGISGEDFDYVVDDMCKTLDKYNVPTSDKNEVFAMLQQMKPDIVETR